ncbi:MAG: toxin co-regulated pilus biosynthesis Q family protein [Caldilinea sp.]|nr:toxin co-regulated pilus biosynthesis Q family protein [Caldilinea sp.]MDW8438903.1 TcpQ domain-containing protein [Caldilineaceae bacterium]
MKIRWLCLALAMGFSTAARANCEDLGRMTYRADWGIGLPVSAAVNDMIRKTNWKADVRAKGQEPRIVGRLYGSVASILDGIVSHLQKEGVRVNYRIYHDECRIFLAMQDVSTGQDRTLTTTQETRALTKDPSTQTSDAVSLRLLAGKRLSEQIEAWLRSVGWKLVWELDVDWVVPADIEMSSADPLRAVDMLSKWLSQEGKPVQFIAFEANKVMVAKALATTHGSLQR